MLRLGWKIKFCFVILFGLFGATSDAQQADEATTWYVVRHADRDGSQDALTQAGVKRSERLADLMGVLRVTDIYSTDTRRTRETAQPTATRLSLPVNLYGELSKSWFEALKKKHTGDVVLLVGHSNTVDRLVEGLGGKGDFSVEDDEYDSLFVVSTEGRSARALRVHFGDNKGHQ